MAAGVLILVLATLTWSAESQFLPGTGFQQSIPNTVSQSPCGCPSGEQFLSPTSFTSNLRPSVLSNTGPQYDSVDFNLASFGKEYGCGTGFQQSVPNTVSQLPCGCLSGEQFLSPTGSCASNLRSSVLSKKGPQYDSVGSNLATFGKECGYGFSTSQCLSPVRPTGIHNIGSQCQSTSCLGAFGTGPCNSFSNTNTPSNFPSISSCDINGPSFISNGPNSGLNNFAGPITNQVTETTTTQIPSISGNKQFVSETFVAQNPCQSCSSPSHIGLMPSSSKIGQINYDTACVSPVTETCIQMVDDDKCMSTTLANALQLLIVSNLIENLNEATALGTFNSPQPPCNLIENSIGCKAFSGPANPIVTGSSVLPSSYSPLSVGSLSSNTFGAPCQGTYNTRFSESINPIRVTPLSTFGGVPEIVNSNIPCGAPHIPDIINPTNLKLAEAINAQLPFGPLPSYNGNFAGSTNSIHLPSLAQPLVLPEIGNPVNLPAFGSIFPNKAEGNPFRVQSFSPLASPPGIVAYNVPNGPFQVPEQFNYNQFNGPFLPDASNYNEPLLPEIFNSNQFNEPTNPLMALLIQLLEERSSAYNAPGSPDLYNPYSSYGAYPKQNSFEGAYGSPFDINNQYSTGYPVSATSALLELISSKSKNGAIAEILAPLLSSLGKTPYTENPGSTLPVDLPSPNYASEELFPNVPSSFTNKPVKFSSSANDYNHPEVVYVPVDIPGLPVTSSRTLPEVPLSVTPSASISEVNQIPAQFTFEPLIAELLIPSSIPAELLVSF